MMGYVIKVRTEDGREIHAQVQADTDDEAFEAVKRLHPKWKDLMLEESWDPKKLSTFDMEDYPDEDPGDY